MPKGDLKYLEGGKKSSDEEIRAGLANSNEKEKLEAMKQIVGLMSMGKDTSDLFPDVVMNVVCQSLELKKLVYTYLLRYAEEKSDVALLSINTFQKDMEHSNQLIRALALRVISGLGLPMINQLVMLAIKKAANDPSPYVRKTAAYAIPKLYRMDPEQLPALFEVLMQLMNDKMVLVLSGAICTFCEIAPNKLDILHPYYRRLCHMLVDMDEWGQIQLLGLLLRYGRTQFLNPVKPKKEKPEKPAEKGKKKKKKKEKSFYSDDDSDDNLQYGSDDDEDYELMDEDHRLLLKCAYPLLQSRNSGVVMAVAALYWHLADENDAAKVARPLVRLLRGHREVQCAVLSNIATWCSTRSHLFKPFMYEFFVKGDDGRMQRELKLEILVHIVDQDNISSILKEFQTYIKHSDKKFVGLTIQSLGRCAAQMETVAETCLRYLMSLIKSKSDAVVSESIVAIRHLLQYHQSFVRDGVLAMTRHLQHITVPRARASIAWVIGEFIDQVPTFGPDALRLLLKDFANQDFEVKMQTLNLGCKVYLNNREESEPYVQYLFDLCKYDSSYDLRDRARLLKAAIMTGEDMVKDLALPLLRSQKPPPLVASSMKDRQRYCTGSLSQLVNHTAMGYIALSEFPAVRPDPSVRDAPINTYGASSSKKKKKKKKTKDGKKQTGGDDLDSFYNDDSSGDSSSDGDEDSDEESSSSGSDDSGGFEPSKDFYDSVSSESETDSDEDSDTDSDKDSSDEDSSDDESSSEEVAAKKGGGSDSSDESSSEESSSEDEATTKPTVAKPSVNLLSAKGDSDSSSDTDDGMDLLGDMGGAPSAPSTKAPAPSSLDLGDIFGDEPSNSGGDGPVGGMLQANKSAVNVTTSSALPKSSLLNHVTTRGLGVEYQFVRTLSAADTNVVRLFFKNHSSMAIQSIKVSKSVEAGGQSMVPFPPISMLGAGATTEATVNIDFNQKNQPARFEISDCNGTHTAVLHPRVGELFNPDHIGVDEFKTSQTKLQGMNKTSGTATSKSGLNVLDTVTEFTNLALVNQEDGEYLFAGRTMTGSNPMLLVLKDEGDNNYKYDIHLENAILGNAFSAEFKKALANA